MLNGWPYLIRDGTSTVLRAAAQRAAAGLLDAIGQQVVLALAAGTKPHGSQVHNHGVGEV